MVFRDKYELLALRNGDREIALTGREILSGQPAVVHLLAGRSPADVRGLIETLNGLPAALRQYVIETGDHEGIPYVVTRALPAALGLQGWLENLDVRTSIDGAKAMEPAEEPGEFTRLFVKPQVDPPPAPVATPAEPPDPGEFTRMLEAPQAAKPAPAPASAAPANAPGAFTRMLKEEIPPPRSSARPEPDAAGEFTHMFASDRQPADTTALPVQSAPGPGEYTRMFAAPPPARVAATAPQVPALATPPAPPAKSKFPLIAILGGGLFLLVAILLVVFALAR